MNLLDILTPSRTIFNSKFVRVTNKNKNLYIKGLKFSVLTIELHTDQVKPKLFSLFSTAADESRKIVIPVKPVNSSSTVVGNGRIALVVDILGKSSSGPLGIVERQ